MRRLLLIVTILTAGCTTDREFGAVIRANVAAQTVDANPTYAGVPVEGGSGVLGVSAIERYHERKTAPLTRASSTNAGNVSGGSGGSQSPQN